MVYINKSDFNKIAINYFRNQIRRLESILDISNERYVTNPKYEFKKERDILDKSNKVAGEKGIRSYWESSNTKSLDGLKTNIIEKNIGK